LGQAMLRDAPLVHFDDVLREARTNISLSQSIAGCGGGFNGGQCSGRDQ
jgi:hypothetical protein